MKEQKADWEEEFDRRFAKIAHLGHGECVIVDATGKKFTAHLNSNGDVIEIGGLECIKDFFRYTVLQERQAERERCIRLIKTKNRHESTCECLESGPGDIRECNCGYHIINCFLQSLNQ